LVKRVYKAGILSLPFLLLAASGHAQSPPGPLPPISRPVVGFVSPYEIMRTLRAAGFEPLSPPLREGTDYVLRANDFRGILMHVVVDARTAAIRDATRIVPGPGRYGQYYGEPAYGPADYGAPLAPPTEASIEPPPPLPPPVRPLTPAPRVIPDAAIASPPLPRPRPATLVSSKSDSTYPAAKPLPPPAINTAPNAVTSAPVVGPPAASAAAIAKPPAEQDAKAPIKSEVITAAPPPASAPPKRAPTPIEPLND
jgi:hypothetical protein